MPFRPLLIRPGDPAIFPNPRSADSQGLVAVGGDLSAERLLAAYESGIFPWYDAELPLWWSPHPRAVMAPRALHVSRSLRRFLQRARFRVSLDEAFGAVVKECSREREDGTWIHPEMMVAYGELAARGQAHSVEVWDGDALIGGLYGVSRGALFAAESMFHRRTNASKVALVTALLVLFDAGVSVFDVQFLTDHLESLGAFEISRDEYLAQVRHAAEKPAPLDALRGRDLLPRALALLPAPRAPGT